MKVLGKVPQITWKARLPVPLGSGIPAVFQTSCPSTSPENGLSLGENYLSEFETRETHLDL